MTELDLGPAPDPRDLELLRRDVAVGGETRARVRARLAETVLAAAAVGAAGAGAHRVGRVLGAHTYGLVAAAFLAGTVTGAVVCARWMARSAPRVEAVDLPAAAPALRMPAASPPVTVTSPAAPASPSTVTTTTPETTAVSSSAPRMAGTSQLSAERHMLDDARHALLQGDPARSLEILERHRRAFPSPLLAEEHGALEVQSLAKAERYGEARTLGEAFRRRYPDSLYLPMVDAALAAMP